MFIFQWMLPSPVFGFMVNSSQLFGKSISELPNWQFREPIIQAGNLHLDRLRRVASQHSCKIALQLIRTQVIWPAVEMFRCFP